MLGRCLFNVYRHKPLPGVVVKGLSQLFVHPITSSYAPLFLDTLRTTIMTHYSIQFNIQSLFNTFSSSTSSSSSSSNPSIPTPLQKPHSSSLPSQTSIESSQFGYANEILRVQIQSLDLFVGKLDVILPYRYEFTGNFSTPCLHGGVLGSLMDHCGYYLSKSLIKEENAEVKRLSYRVDYLSPAPCFEETLCETILIERKKSMICIDSICWNKQRTKKLAIGRLKYIIIEQ